METSEFTRITAETSGQEKITSEFPYTDVTVTNMCQAFHTIMVGMTFTDESVGEMLASYLEEYYGERYNVVNINE